LREREVAGEKWWEGAMGGRWCEKGKGGLGVGRGRSLRRRFSPPPFRVILPFLSNTVSV
jgi:hypothetical protein